MKTRAPFAPRPCAPASAAWLQAGGSLTARLRQHGRTQVVVLRQGSQRLWPQERQVLHGRSGHVREVLLLVDGRPAVWARSATPHSARRGSWKAVALLGNRPLADILFHARRVDRSPLQPILIRPHGPVQCAMRKAWRQHAAATPVAALPRWGRSSVFVRKGQPLRVFEAIAPWVLALDLQHPSVR